MAQESSWSDFIELADSDAARAFAWLEQHEPKHAALIDQYPRKFRGRLVATLATAKREEIDEERAAYARGRREAVAIYDIPTPAGCEDLKWKAMADPNVTPQDFALMVLERNKEIEARRREIFPHVEAAEQRNRLDIDDDTPPPSTEAQVDRLRDAARSRGDRPGGGDAA